MRIFIAVFSALTLPLALSQQESISECAQLLKPNVTEIQTSDVVRLSYLYTLDRGTYEAKQKSGELTAGIVVEGIPISAGMSWDEFQQRREREKSQKQFTYDRTQASWYYASTISDLRGQQFLECMYKSGLKLVPRAVTDTSVTLILRWYPSAPVQPAVLRFETVGQPTRPTEMAKLPTRIPVNSEESASFARDPTKPLTIVVKTGTSAQVFFVPPKAVLKPVPLPSAPTISNLLDSGKQCVVVFANTTAPNQNVGYIWRGLAYHVLYSPSELTLETKGCTNRDGCNYVIGKAPVPLPSSERRLNLFGKMFKYDETGNIVAEEDPAFRGMISCLSFSGS